MIASRFIDFRDRVQAVFRAHVSQSAVNVFYRQDRENQVMAVERIFAYVPKAFFRMKFICSEEAL